jgi:SIR2-like domain
LLLAPRRLDSIEGGFVELGSSNYRLIGISDDGGVADLLQSLNKHDARQRLQALIAEWLRMENLVVLAGAGTSVSSGGKVMASLEKSVLTITLEMKNQSKPVRSLIEQRLQTLGTAARVPFEDWLSYLVNASFIGSHPSSPFTGVEWRGGVGPSPDQLSELIVCVSSAIFAECALTIPSLSGDSTAENIAPHLSFLAKVVARDSNLGRAHVFTLNYDTLFEQALELLGIQYFDGFTGRADARFDPSVYGLDIYYPGEIAEGRVRRFDKFLHLYKLHGSIHWQIDGNEVRARHPDLRELQKYHSLSFKEKARELPDLSRGRIMCGILPTANKFAQTLTMPFSHIFRSFQIRLAAPQTFLLVLGFGFADEHVTRIVEAALMNPSLVMLVVEPNPKTDIVARIKRYKELGKRAFVLTQTEDSFDRNGFELATFDDFSRSIMPDVQWLDDFLRLRRFEKQIQTYETNEGRESEKAS